MIDIVLGVAKDVLVSVVGGYVYDKMSESHKQALAKEIASEVASQLRQQRSPSQMQIMAAAKSAARHIIPDFKVNIIKGLLDDADRLAREADTLSAEINRVRWIVHPGWVQQMEQQRAGLFHQRQECLRRADALVNELGFG